MIGLILLMIGFFFLNWRRRLIKEYYLNIFFFSPHPKTFFLLNADDIRLVWANCMTYNQDGSDFFLLAKNLGKKFEEKYSKIVKDFQLDIRPPVVGGGGDSSGGAGGGANTSGIVTLDEKRSFARGLYQISKEDLGKLIVEVDHKCPAAITKNMGEDEAELNVDKIPAALFQELKSFVTNCHKTAPASAAGTKKGTKRKA